MSISQKDLDGLNSLKDLVVKIESSEEISKTQWLSNGEQHPLVEQAGNLCCELFIAGGGVRFAMINLLKESYNLIVEKGESDSFGWLTGVLRTSKGRICYG